jgi:hypothetical protein
VVLAAHQREFDLVLNILDMERTAFAHPACQRAKDIGSQLLDRLMHAPRCRSAVPLHRKEGLGHGAGDLCGIEA